MKNAKPYGDDIVETEALYLEASGLKFGKVDIYSTPNQADFNRPRNEKILVDVVMSGICGTDRELIKKAKNGEISSNYPERSNRLVIGHEGVIYDPGTERYGVVVVRGSNDLLPHRYGDGSSIFEYGIFKEDGLHSRQAYVNPDMIVWIPEGILPRSKKIGLPLLKKLLFSEPYAVVRNSITQSEDAIVGVNNVIEQAYKDYIRSFQRWAFDADLGKNAIKSAYNRGIVISAAGTIGTIAAYMYHKRGKELAKKYEDSIFVYESKPNIVVIDLAEPDSVKASFITKHGVAKYVQNKGNGMLEDIRQALNGRQAGLFVGCGGYPEEGAIGLEVLSHNGVYSNLSLGSKITIDTDKLCLNTLTITGAVNFSKKDMEAAVREIPEMPFDEMVKVHDWEDLRNPEQISKIFGSTSPDEPAKRAILWHPELVDS